ncbi:MAG: hypothetical protein ACK53J_15090, partial [Betaproteobacteria bacterium]
MTMWLDFAEDPARRRKEVFLKNWVERLEPSRSSTSAMCRMAPARFPSGEPMLTRKASTSISPPSG